MLRVVAAALSAAAAAAESNRTASRLGRLQDIDDWLSNASGGPPRHWRVRSPADVSGNSTALVESYQKEVNISRLAGSAAPVVVKALQNAGAFAFGHRESDIAYFELLYLEWLRARDDGRCPRAASGAGARSGAGRRRGGGRGGAAGAADAVAARGCAMLTASKATATRESPAPRASRLCPKYACHDVGLMWSGTRGASAAEPRALADRGPLRAVRGRE